MKKFKNIPGFLISFLLLFFLFYKVDLPRFASVFVSINVFFVLAVLLLVVFGCYLRAIRWHYLLTPIKNIKASDLFPAVIVGYMGNNLFPMRAGEFLRAHFIGKQQKISRVAAFSTIIMERLADGLSILLILVPIVFLLKIKMQQALITAAVLALFLYLVVIAIIMLFHFKKQACIDLIAYLTPRSFRQKLVSIIASLADGFGGIKHMRQLIQVALFSLLIWLVTGLSIQLIVMAFNYTISFAAAMFVLIILTFVVMLPSAPGFIGTFDAGMVYALMLFAVPREAAIGMAVLYHGLNFLLVMVLGFYYMWKYNLSFVENKEV